MQKLLDGGLAVDAEDGNGETALWFAVTHDKLDFAQKLLDHGANIHHVNHRNHEIGEMISRVSTNPKTLKWVEDKLGKPLP